MTKYMEALQRQFIAEIAKNNMEYYRVAPEKVINSLPIDLITLVKDSMWSIRKEYGCKATVKVTFKVGDGELCGGFYEEVTSSIQSVSRTGIRKTNYSEVADKIEVACNVLKETLMEQLARQEKTNLLQNYSPKDDDDIIRMKDEIKHLIN